MRAITRAIVWLLVLLGILIGVARITAIRWWRVPDDDPYLEASIAPTLRGGDLLILWRLTPPMIGDLVLCPEPVADPEEAEASREERIVIGRVIAQAGDSVKITSSTIHVNGEALRSDSTCPEGSFSTRDPETDEQLSQRCALEKIGSNVHMVGGARGDIPMPPDRKSMEVGDGQVWLASDNRILPYDSRDYGPVEVDTCKETIALRLVSAEGYFDAESRLTLIR